MNLSGKVLLIGDLNAKHANWNCYITNENGVNFINNSNTILQAPNKHIRRPENNTKPTTIDLILNSNVPNITEPKTEFEKRTNYR